MPWSIDFNRLMDLAEEDAEKRLQELSMVAFRGVVFRSPVDTGRFVGNWIATVNRFSDVTTEGTVGQKEGAKQTAFTRETRRVEAVGLDDILYIQNNLPYAVRLEEGYSDQAPGGMMALAMADVMNRL